MQLSINSACKHVLIESLEYLVCETYNWFSKSAKGRSDYKKVYQLINFEEVKRLSHFCLLSSN